MSFYEQKILPYIIDFACSAGPMMKLRAKLVPNAKGQVLEVGMGSGVNLSLYDVDQVEKVYGLEPSHGMRLRAQKNLDASNVEVDWLDLPGELIPLEDNSVDTVLLTFTLCTIPDWLKALQQMKRVLKTDGQLLFLEHGLSPDDSVASWQNKLTPMWRKMFGGCHLNRSTSECLETAGFTIESLENFYLDGGPKFASYMAMGKAHIAS
jgi:ubiquinone/menaquinone biosynthesis C-methylase UbiE